MPNVHSEQSVALRAPARLCGLTAILQFVQLSDLLSGRKKVKDRDIVAEMAEPRHQPGSSCTSGFSEQNTDPEHVCALEQIESRAYRASYEDRPKVSVAERQCCSDNSGSSGNLSLFEPPVHQLTKQQLLDTGDE